MDSIISKEFANPNDPGGVFMVSRNGKHLCSKAVGKANTELGVDFFPGEKYDYNISGYIILGYLIEIIAGQSYESFIEERIFQKIGMTNSFMPATGKSFQKELMDISKKTVGLSIKQISTTVCRILQVP